jgi:hypothetical protein
LLDADQTARSTLSIKMPNRKPFADFTRPKTGLPDPAEDTPPMDFQSTQNRLTSFLDVAQTRSD